MPEKLRIFTGPTWQDGHPTGQRAVCAVTGGLGEVQRLLHTNKMGLYILGWYEIKNMSPHLTQNIERAKITPHTLIMLDPAPPAITLVHNLEIEGGEKE